MEGINQTQGNAIHHEKISRKCMTNDKLLWYQTKKNSPLTIHEQFPKMSVM
jgi:hypothetical protein